MGKIYTDYKRWIWKSEAKLFNIRKAWCSSLKLDRRKGGIIPPWRMALKYWVCTYDIYIYGGMYHCQSKLSRPRKCDGWTNPGANMDLKVKPPKTHSAWLRKIKPGFLWRRSGPNDRNMPTQHISTLLGATYCVRLAIVLRCVATGWVMCA